MRCGVSDGEAGEDTILLIGYGNTLRRDDGIGIQVAESLAATDLPGVRVQTVHQLVPELAAELAEARAVLFVDATLDPGRIAVELTPVAAQEITDGSTHHVDPRTLLALTRAVYGRAPEAWWLTVPGQDFGFGEGLSATARRNAQIASQRLQSWIAAKVAGNQNPRQSVSRLCAQPAAGGHSE